MYKRGLKIDQLFQRNIQAVCEGNQGVKTGYGFCIFDALNGFF